VAASGTTLHQRAGRMDDVFLVYRPGASGGTGSTMAGAAVAGHPYPLPLHAAVELAAAAVRRPRR
jgi:hypothetical protein